MRRMSRSLRRRRRRRRAREGYGLLYPREPRAVSDCYARIEALVDGPYLELFARQERPGWDSFGNEVGKFAPEPRQMQFDEVSG